MQIAIASDHAGYRLKCSITTYLSGNGFEAIDYGTNTEVPVDYPDYIRPAVESVARNECSLGIVLGGSGNGEAIVANRIKGIRCAVCWNVESARLARAHNDANMISLGSRLVEPQHVPVIVGTWLNTDFDGGRHARRIAKID